MLICVLQFTVFVRYIKVDGFRIKIIERGIFKSEILKVHETSSIWRISIPKKLSCRNSSPHSGDFKRMNM